MKWIQSVVLAMELELSPIWLPIPSSLPTLKLALSSATATASAPAPPQIRNETVGIYENFKAYR